MRISFVAKPLAVTAVIFTIVSAAALAQQPPQQGQDNQDCTVPPGQTTQPGNQPGSAPQPDLSKCKGVLKAPGVGDGEIVTPAPSTGNMPVIKPGQLPPTQNGNSGSGG